MYTFMSVFFLLLIALCRAPSSWSPPCCICPGSRSTSTSWWCVLLSAGWTYSTSPGATDTWASTASWYRRYNPHRSHCRTVNTHSKQSDSWSPSSLFFFVDDHQWYPALSSCLHRLPLWIFSRYFSSVIEKIHPRRNLFLLLFLAFIDLEHGRRFITFF